MLGAALIDAVGSRLGMKSVLSTTTPSRVQILEWINTSAKEMAREMGELMPEIWKVVVFASGVFSMTDVAKIIAVQITDASGANANFSNPNEFFSIKMTTRVDKPVWTFTGVAAPPGTTQTFVVSTGSACVVHYAMVPSDFTDDAVALTVRIPVVWESELIKRASMLGYLSIGNAEALAALTRKGN
jgi:hypothetical protein